MAHLTLMLDNREVRRFELNSTQTTIGRAQDNDIVINNLALSRRHARVDRRGDGGFEVIDLGSQNGVYVNSDRVRDGRLLGDRDTITLGTYNFVFVLDDREGDRPSRTPDRSPEPTPSKREAAPPKREPAPPPGEEPVPLLILKYNDVELQRFPAKVDLILVGRAKECEVQIPERRLSRKHCQITRDESGKFFVSDLGSQNGTYVNRRRIRGFHELRHGDVLNFAEYTISFLDDEDAYAGPDRSREPSEVPLPIEPQVGRPPLDPMMAGEETVMPAAYSDEYGYDEEPYDDPIVQPQPFDGEDADTPAPPVSIPRASRGGPPSREPVVERPNINRARRTQGPARGRDEAAARPAREDARPARDEARGRREDPRPTGRPARDEPPRARREDASGRPTREPVREEPRPAAEPKREPKRDRAEPPRERGPRRDPAEDADATARPRRRPVEEVDRRAPRGEPPRRARGGREDPDLDSWYAGRDASALYDPLGDDPARDDEDDAGLVRREASSVSHVLSTMMVDKRELDRNLKKRKKPKSRPFFARVRHEDQLLFEGPLEEAVTILGTDADADIPLRGRYVAGRHSLLVRVRDSLLLVRLGSSSAARVNGLPKLQSFLKSGDVIQIDETTIEISEK